MVSAPTVWGPEPADAASRAVSGGQVDPLWWQSFRDPKLTSLVGRLVAQNLDLQTAAERIIQGRAQRQVTAAQGLPQINARSSFDHERQSPTGFISLVTPSPSAIPNTDYDVWQNGLQASW